MPIEGKLMSQFYYFDQFGQFGTEGVAVEREEAMHLPTCTCTDGVIRRKNDG